MYRSHPNAILHTTTHHNPRKRIYFEHPDPKIQFQQTEDYFNKNIFLKSRSRMPTKYKKRKNKKRGRKRRRIPRAITSKQKVIMCKVSKYVSNTCTSGALSMHKVNGMSVVDPFVGSATGQPLGYDQWKALYDKAYVIGCKVKLTVHNGSTNSVVYGITAMKQNQGTTALSDYEYYRETPSTVSRLLSPDVDHGFITLKKGTKKHCHLTNLVDEEHEIDLNSETEPSYPYYFHLWCQPADKATTVNNIEFIMDVEYIVLLRDPIIPSRSTHS